MIQLLYIAKAITVLLIKEETKKNNNNNKYITKK